MNNPMVKVYNENIGEPEGDIPTILGFGSPITQTPFQPESAISVVENVLSLGVPPNEMIWPKPRYRYRSSSVSALT